MGAKYAKSKLAEGSASPDCYTKTPTANCQHHTTLKLMNMKFMIMKQARHLISALHSGDCDSRGIRVEGGERREDGTDVLILDIRVSECCMLYIVYYILWVHQTYCT
jgi:hypothetical protein